MIIKSIPGGVVIVIVEDVELELEDEASGSCAKERRVRRRDS